MQLLPYVGRERCYGTTEIWVAAEELPSPLPSSCPCTTRLHWLLWKASGACTVSPVENGETDITIVSKAPEIKANSLL